MNNAQKIIEAVRKGKADQVYPYQDNKGNVVVGVNSLDPMSPGSVFVLEFADDAEPAFVNGVVEAALLGYKLLEAGRLQGKKRKA